LRDRGTANKRQQKGRQDIESNHGYDKRQMGMRNTE
jgi:hypothetical protein